MLQAHVGSTISGQVSDGVDAAATVRSVGTAQHHSSPEDWALHSSLDGQQLA